MCAKRSLKQPVSENPSREAMMSSLIPGNTARSGYHNWRVQLRSSARSPARNDAGRNALSGVKVSSSVNQYVPEWPSYYEDAKATPVDSSSGTLGVQVHGMYRRLFQKLGRSPSVVSMKKSTFSQDVTIKCKSMQRREVRWSHSSEEVE